jgi:hypothetical protein
VARTARLLPAAGFVLGVIGLALLVLEVVRTLNGSALATVGAVLLWVGVGFIAVAILLLAFSVMAPATEQAPADEPAPAEAEAGASS